MSPLERLLTGSILCDSFPLDREVERQDKEKIALKKHGGINILEYFWKSKNRVVMESLQG